MDTSSPESSGSAGRDRHGNQAPVVRIGPREHHIAIVIPVDDFFSETRRDEDLVAVFDGDGRIDVPAPTTRIPLFPANIVFPTRWISCRSRICLEDSGAGLAEVGLEPLNGRERIAFIGFQSLAFLEILTPIPERPAPFPRDRRTRNQNQACRQNAYMTV